MPGLCYELTIIQWIVKLVKYKQRKEAREQGKTTGEDGV